MLRIGCSDSSKSEIGSSGTSAEQRSGAVASIEYDCKYTQKLFSHRVDP
jgi:hypothetical protein